MPQTPPTPPSDRRPRVGLISLGCPKNLVDSEIMLGELARRGYDVVGDLDAADTVLVNTCAFIEEAQQLEAAGITELNLIAQDTTRYGEDLGMRRHGLVRLVEALLAATSIPWIRFLYAYPTTLDEDLLRLMGSEERFCSYLDMPLQHSHGDILAAMRRGGDAKRYLRLLERARELAPDVFLRSTFIVGFPRETEVHFRDLLAFVREARFDHLGGFAYSPEADTPGAALPGRVPKQVARRRLRQLLEAQRPIALAQRERLLGRRLRALVEGPCAET